MSNIIQRDYLICPWCEAETDSRIDHLYAEAPREFGPWYCDECGRSFTGTLASDRGVTLSRDERTRFVPCFVLLKRDDDEGPLYFVMKHRRYVDHGDATDAAQQLQFFFEEHSCPTNWLGECAAVIEGIDDDPHGFLSFVRFVDVPIDFDETNTDRWRTLFPELPKP